MKFIQSRFNYLFGSTKGLILVAIAMIAIVTTVWGMLFSPMAELGVREVVVKLLGMDMMQAEREGRIIILYHSIAMTIVAIEVYMITSLLKMKPFFNTAKDWISILEDSFQIFIMRLLARWVGRFLKTWWCLTCTRFICIAAKNPLCISGERRLVLKWMW